MGMDHPSLFKIPINPGSDDPSNGVICLIDDINTFALVKWITFLSSPSLNHYLYF